MFPQPFDYHDPDSTEEALALLGEYGADARVLAGGQTLVAAMNLGLAQPRVIVDLNRLRELAYVTLRSLMLALYARAWFAVPEARPLVRFYGLGYALGVGIWLSSLAVPAPGPGDRHGIPRHRATAAGRRVCRRGGGDWR